MMFQLFGAASARLFRRGAIGLATLTLLAGTSAQAAGSCGPDAYVNSSGACVHRPVRAASAPAGATARCRDGTYSFSQHHQGTCSHHGGVAAWL